MELGEIFFLQDAALDFACLRIRRPLLRPIYSRDVVPDPRDNGDAFRRLESPSDLTSAAPPLSADLSIHLLLERGSGSDLYQ